MLFDKWLLLWLISPQIFLFFLLTTLFRKKDKDARSWAKEENDNEQTGK